jgi:Ni2+-binding GTPase involved in maturation of urease and hydrogenase
LYSGDTSIVTERKETVELIQIMLQKHRYVHIRAPPFSGKTALAQLLEKYETTMKWVAVVTIVILQSCGRQEARDSLDVRAYI